LAAANQREAARRAALEYTYLARKLIDGKQGGRRLVAEGSHPP
jgi:hypothetical protein